MPRHNIFSFIASDYRRLGYQSRVSHIFKSIFNPSLQIAILIRCVQCSNFVFYPIFRFVTLFFFSVDVGYKVKIGYGLLIPHPIGIVIGAGSVVGRNITIYQGVTIGSKNGHYPKIGNNVTIFCNSVIVGKIKLASGCIVGACKFLDKNLDKKNMVFK